MSYVAILREAGSIGDTVMCFVVAAVLRHRYPDAQVVHFGFEPLRSLVALDPNVDHFVAVPHDKRRPRNAPLDPKRWPYLNSGPVPIGQYLHVADCWHPYTAAEKAMSGRPRSDWHDRIITGLKANGLLAPDLPPELLTPRAAIPRDAVAWAHAWLGNHGLLGKIVGLQPFSSSQHRNWPKPSWAALASELLKRGLKVVIFDGNSGRTAGIPGVPCLGHPFDRLAALIAHCSLMITPDSGLFHLAAAVGRPTLGLFGSTDGLTIASHYPKAKILQRRPDRLRLPSQCQYPCWCLGQRGVAACNGRYCAALAAISPNDVLAKLDRSFPGLLPPGGAGIVPACSVPSSPSTLDPRPSSSSSRPHAGIVMTCSAIGDTIFAFPVAQELKRRGHEVTVWSYPKTRDLWAMCDSVDHWVELQAGTQRPTGNFDARRYPCFDRGPVPIKQFARVHDIWRGCARARAINLRNPVARWHSRTGVFLRELKLHDDLPGAERFARYAPRVTVPAAAARQAEAWLSERVAQPPTAVVGLHIYANCGERSWTAEPAQELIRLLADRGITTIVFDRDARSASLGGVQALGLPLPGLAALIARCDAFIGVDSGPHNLAAAVGVPTIGLFGYSPGAVVCEYFPRTIVLQKQPGEFTAPRGCLYPCYEQRARGAGLCRGRTCPALAAITPPEIVSAVESIFVRQKADAEAVLGVAAAVGQGSPDPKPC